MSNIPHVACDACRRRGKDWPGDDPRCAFRNGGQFASDNWNCATANAIRDLCDPDAKHPAVDHRYCEDQHYATILINDIDLPDSGAARALWVSWYKSRGRTEAMWLLDEEDQPRRPTEADCAAILLALAPAVTA